MGQIKRELASNKSPDAMVEAANFLMRGMCWLSDNGYQPLIGDVGMYKRPVIAIAYTPRCEALKRSHAAEEIGISNTYGRQLRRWQCQIRECWVEWFEES